MIQTGSTYSGTLRGNNTPRPEHGQPGAYLKFRHHTGQTVNIFNFKDLRQNLFLECSASVDYSFTIEYRSFECFETIVINKQENNIRGCHSLPQRSKGEVCM